MAKEFPHASVVGVDLAPCPVEQESLPPNCRFEVQFESTHYSEKLLMSLIYYRWTILIWVYLIGSITLTLFIFDLWLAGSKTFVSGCEMCILVSNQGAL